jgi:short-subunit dehydrogenase involved in D-alanine esterification of teichoic acids
VSRLDGMNISGNTIFIPGSTSGIGLSLARALRARGNTVVVGGRRKDLLDQIAADDPGIDTVLIESIRLQLEDTTVRVVELEPPSVRTALVPGQQDSEFAMPLEEFTAEVMTLLEAQPDAKEIQVERVKFLRYGEARGDYDQVVATLNAADPHGK